MTQCVVNANWSLTSAATEERNSEAGERMRMKGAKEESAGLKDGMTELRTGNREVTEEHLAVRKRSSAVREENREEAALQQVHPVAEQPRDREVRRELPVLEAAEMITDNISRVYVNK